MNNKIRIILIGVVTIIIFSVLFIVLPVTPHSIIAYIFAVLGVVGLMASILILTTKKLKVVQDVPLINTAWVYLVVNILVSIIGMILSSQISWQLFLVAHVILVAIFIIRVIILSAGKAYIESRENQVQSKTMTMHTFRADINKILIKAKSMPSVINENALNELQSISDALRYADPVSNTSLQTLDSEIQTELTLLDEAVEIGNLESISKITLDLRRVISTRNEQAKQTK